MSRTPRSPAPTTHAHDGGVVVFHIGMTIARPWRPDQWGPVFTAMGRMLAELDRARAAEASGDGTSLGCLGASTLLGAQGPVVVQYWRSVEHLYAYAHAAEGRHVTAWRAFNQAARRHPGAVGVWHETFVVEADGIETFYGNGAHAGLGRFTGSLPIAARGRTARQRLGRPVTA